MKIESIVNISRPGFPAEAGDRVKITYVSGDTEERLWRDVNAGREPDKPVMPEMRVSNIRLYSKGLPVEPVGSIYWINQHASFRLVADLAMPEGFEDMQSSLVVMAERLVDGTRPVDDHRFIANIFQGELVMESDTGFSDSGNFFIQAARLNRGLERIGAPFRVRCDTIEFDVVRP